MSTRERAALQREIEQTVTQTAHETGRAHLDRRVLAVLGRLPHHLFVPAALRGSAYDNRPLPIGHGNGCMSVCAAVLASLLAMHFGFHSVLLAAAARYALAAMLWRS